MEHVKEIKRLYTFKTVYELNSFSQASKILFMTQSAISIQIQQLEKELGTVFFKRSGRNAITPTVAGHLFYKRVLVLIDEWQNTQSILNDASKIRNRCVLGCSHSFSNHYLPNLIIELCKTFPNIDFEFSIENSQYIYDCVLKREMDFGIIEQPLPIKNTLRRIELIYDPLVLAGNPNGENWIMREKNSGVHYYNTMYLNEEGIKPDSIITVNNNDTILRILENGWGTSLVSKENAKKYTFPTIDLNKKYSRNYYLIETNQHDFLKEIIQFVIDYIKGYQ